MTLRHNWRAAEKLFLKSLCQAAGSGFQRKLNFKKMVHLKWQPELLHLSLLFFGIVMSSLCKCNRALCYLRLGTKNLCSCKSIIENRVIRYLVEVCKLFHAIIDYREWTPFGLSCFYFDSTQTNYIQCCNILNLISISVNTLISKSSIHDGNGVFMYGY